MNELYLALKILSISLLVIISFRATRKVLPFAIKTYKDGNVFLSLVYAVPVIALIALSAFTIYTGYNN